MIDHFKMLLPGEQLFCVVLFPDGRCSLKPRREECRMIVDLYDVIAGSRRHRRCYRQVSQLEEDICTGRYLAKGLMQKFRESIPAVFCLYDVRVIHQTNGIPLAGEGSPNVIL